MNYYDVVVIGTGISGLFTALNVDSHLRVLVITKSFIQDSNSSLAQGGIVCCRNKDMHFKDTLKAGSYYNNEDVVRLIEDYSETCIDKLIAYGVDFEKDECGNFKFTREGGHSEETILYSKDKTGLEIMKCLIQNVRKRENIRVLENTLVTKLIAHGGFVKAVEVIDENNTTKSYHTTNVVLATGGIGRLYKSTTNSYVSSGDGISLAEEIGAKIRDLEFIQFHPTAMVDDSNEKKFLISEAVRGEGGVLKNVNHIRFMKDYHEMSDLAPRDIVARSIYMEMRNTDSDFVFLDATSKDARYLKKRFPNIYETCLEKGIDMSKDFIRVSPSQHYMIGGIETDLRGRTSVDGLYACGECACTGFHGANRLASNSLLEGIVFGKIISEELNKKQRSFYETHRRYETKDNHMVNLRKDSYKLSDSKILEIEDLLKNIMSNYVSVIREEDGLIYAREKINELEKLVLKDIEVSKKKIELRHMLKVSRFIIDASIERKESKGTHFIIPRDGGRLC